MAHEYGNCIMPGMTWLALISGLLAALGVNALADTLPSCRKPGGPRCQHCGAPRPMGAWLGWIAFALGKADCPYCARRMGLRPLAVEIIAVLVALWISQGYMDPAAFWWRMLVFSLFTLIVVIDIEHRLVLHIVTGPAAILIGIVNSIDPAHGFSKTLLGGLAGFGLVLGLFLLGGVFAKAVARIREQELDEIAFGFGDVTLSGVIGLTVGWPGIIPAVLLGVFAAGIFSSGYLLLMLTRRRYVAFTPIPYGPFLVLGGMIVYFGGRSLFGHLLT